MKKITFVILAVILVLAIGIYYKIKIAKLPIENILPEGAVAYVRISDVEKQIDEFKASKLWRNVSNIDVEMLLEKSGVSREQIEEYTNFKRKFSSSIAELVLNKYFGRDIALAFYSSKLNLSDPNSVFEAASNIILVTRLKPEAEFIEFISKLFNKFGKKVKIKEEEYRGRKITVVELSDEFDIAYVKIQDLLVLGLGKKAAHACLDVFNKDKTSLSRDEDYLATMSRLPKPARVVAYGNLELLFSNIKEAIERIAEEKKLTVEQKAEILKPFSQLSGFKTLGFASVGGRISRSKTVFLFDKNMMEPVLAQTYSFKPQKNNTINFVPEDAIYYQWSCFDTKLFWDSFKRALSEESKRPPQGPTFSEIVSNIEKELGISIERDIVAALGNEVGGFLSGIDLNGPIPIPEALLFVKVNNKSAIEKTINACIQKNDVPMQSEDYKGTKIEYIALPFGVGFQPAYCFLNDYLLVSLGRKPLKESIDTLADKSTSLLANEDFKAINFGLTDKNNAIYYLKCDALLKKVKGICEWGFGWVSLASAQAKAVQQNLEREIEWLEKDIKEKESELEVLQATLKSRRNEIENLQSQGLDVTAQQQELARLEDNLRFKKGELNLTKKDLEEKEGSMDITSASPMAKVDAALIRLYLDKAIYPILEGIQTVKAVGSRSVLNENILELQSFTKTEE